MKFRSLVIVSVSFLFVLIVSFAITYQAGTVNKVAMNVVGLYSETAAGSVSYRVGGEKWKVIKLGDQIPDNAEILISVDRDWVELSPFNNINAVYEITGSEKGKVIKKIADLLKQKPRLVSFPKATGDKIDPKFADKVVVKKYLGRQVYQKSPDEEWQDIKYGVILDKNTTINIIAINNTLTLVLPDGSEKEIIGPLKFTVEQVLKGEKLYKYLNVH